MGIACLDAHYLATGARAAGVLLESWEAAVPAAVFVEALPAAEAYQPGSFYRRELPCLLAVLGRFPALPETVVVDGYVWLPPDQRPGLGARLYEALGHATPVVGIAKTAFAGVESCAWAMQVFRGTSLKPLYVTAAGMAPELAARRVRDMAGKHRPPDGVRLADHLARHGLAAAGQAA